MNIINFNFKNVNYFNFENMLYLELVASGTYTITSNHDIILEEWTYGAYIGRKAFLLPYTSMSKYNYTTDTWELIDTMDKTLFDEYIVGVEGDDRHADNLGTTLQITGWIVHDDYEGYLFNDWSYLARLSYNDALGGDENEYYSQVGNNKVWCDWAYVVPVPPASPYYSPIGNAYAVNRFNISEIDDLTATQLINNTLIYNNPTTTPLYVSTIVSEKLPSSYALNSLSVDYSITSETDNNSITCRILDEQNREWLYSETNEQWEYVGQPGGEWATDDGTYQTVAFMNEYIDELTSITAIGIKLKIVSDDNDITLNRITFSVTDTTDYPNTQVRVYGNIKDIIGAAQENILVQISPSIPQASSALDTVYTGVGSNTYTDSNGAFEIEVDVNSEIVVFIPITGFRATITVETDDINLADYIEEIYG